MQHLNASLKHWLKLQCQLLGNVKTALLVNLTQPNPQIMAKWPDASAKNQALLDALKELRHKQRLHLATTESGDLILAQPLVVEGHFRGGLVLQLTLKDKKKVPGVLKSLQEGQIWLQLLLHRADSGGKTAILPGTLSDQASALLAFNARLLKENSLTEMAISLVNLLATELKAARVSMGLLGTNGLVLKAVSFSASFDPRTASMRAIADAMLEAIEQGCAVTYPALNKNTESKSLPITQAHQQLLQVQQAQELQTFLLRKEEQILGAVTLEFHEHQSAKSPALLKEQQQFIAHILMLASSVLALRIQAEAGVWHRLSYGFTRSFQGWFGAARWKFKLLGLSAAILLAVMWIPANYSISGDASLQSLEKHLVVSPQDAYLGAIHARPGDHVSKGQLLAQLKDDDLRLERRKFISQVQQYRQTYDAALANANRVEAAIADAQQEQASIQLRLLEQQLERTRLLAPVDGLVVSDDISQTLGAPLKQGDILFEIAALQGFMVQLYIDERDIAFVAPAQTGSIKLASLPGETFVVHIKAITPLSEVRDGRNYFRVEAELMSDSVLLRPGMSGTGKISAGRRSLGWIWFHDLWHWLRLSLW